MEILTRNLNDPLPQFPPQVDRRVVLALAGEVDEGRPLACGSAVAISERFALTAKHVLEEYLKKPKSSAGRVALIARSGFSTDHQNRDWVVSACSTNEGTEIGLLVFGDNGPPIRGLNYPVLDLIPPREGDEVIAVGFGSSEIEPADREWPDVAVWKDMPSLSVSRVTQIDHQRRDRILMPFPSFSATPCFVPNGASGGPVFNAQGRLCGIISRGEGEPSDESSATISSIWTALLLSTEGLPSEVASTLPRNLLDAAVRGQILARGLDRFSFSHSEDGKRLLSVSLHAR